MIPSLKPVLLSLALLVATLSAPTARAESPLEHRRSDLDAVSIREIDRATGDLKLLPKKIRIKYDYSRDWIFNYANVTLECIFKEDLPRMELNRRAYITDMIDTISLRPAEQTSVVGRFFGWSESEDEEEDQSRDRDGYRLKHPESHYENPSVAYDPETKRLDIVFRPEGLRDCRERLGTNEIFAKLKHVGDLNRAKWGDPTLSARPNAARRAVDDGIRALGGSRLFPELDGISQNPCPK